MSDRVIGGVSKDGTDVWVVQEILCPVHGEVTGEIARRSCPEGWTGLVLEHVMRARSVHGGGCAEQLLWAVYPR